LSIFDDDRKPLTKKGNHCDKGAGHQRHPVLSQSHWEMWAFFGRVGRVGLAEKERKKIMEVFFI